MQKNAPWKKCSVFGAFRFSESRIKDFVPVRPNAIKSARNDINLIFELELVSLLPLMDNEDRTKPSPVSTIKIYLPNLR